MNLLNWVFMTGAVVMSAIGLIIAMAHNLIDRHRQDQRAKWDAPQPSEPWDPDNDAFTNFYGDA